MAPVQRMRSIILALLLTLFGAPAFADQRAPAVPKTPPVRGIVLRLLHLITPVLEKLGPGMDPLGAPVPQPDDPAPGTTRPESQGDLGPGMDPLG